MDRLFLRPYKKMGYVFSRQWQVVSDTIQWKKLLYQRKLDPDAKTISAFANRVYITYPYAKAEKINTFK
jgi:hypothetical protein